MPYIRVETNIQLKKDRASELATALSRTASQVTGKSENYVMASVTSDQPMAFAASASPCAYVEFKSIGLPDSQLKDISSSVCSLLQKEIDIAPDRIYIEMKTVERSHWGWNGSTF